MDAFGGPYTKPHFEAFQEPHAPFERLREPFFSLCLLLVLKVSRGLEVLKPGRASEEPKTYIGAREGERGKQRERESEQTKKAKDAPYTPRHSR